MTFPLVTMSSDDANVIFGGGLPFEKIEQYSSIGDQLISDLEIGGTRAAFVSLKNQNKLKIYSI